MSQVPVVSPVPNGMKHHGKHSAGSSRPQPAREPQRRVGPGEERFFATCPRGLEAALAVELESLGAQGARAADGGVAFEGKLDLAYAINLWSRLASRVLWQVGAGRYRDQQDIYDAALRLHWPQWFAVANTIRVNVTAIRSPLTSLDFITLKIKDAVCDRFRSAVGERPSVDTAAPDVRIHAFLTADTCTFYLDTSGEALFKRGYRRDALEAPLRENLAAGLLKLAGWNAALPLLDPFCGSGTILIEAAMMGCDIAPGFSRVFGFRRLSWFNAEVWQAAREDAARRGEAGRASAVLRLVGSDISPPAIAAARAHVAALGLDAFIALGLADARSATAPAAAGLIVTNPPYGVRLGADEDLPALYAAFGDTLKRNFAGWHAYVLCGEMGLMKAIRLAPSRKIPLYNGALECRLVEYRLVAGSNRRQSGASEAPVSGKMPESTTREQ
jgi:putative N6-adenine-specific DNA methylase